MSTGAVARSLEELLLDGDDEGAGAEDASQARRGDEEWVDLYMRAEDTRWRQLEEKARPARQTRAAEEAVRAQVARVEAARVAGAEEASTAEEERGRGARSRQRLEHRVIEQRRERAVELQLRRRCGDGKSGRWRRLEFAALVRRELVVA